MEPMLSVAEEYADYIKRPGKTATTLQDICQRFYKLRRQEEERAALQALHMLRSHMLVPGVVPLQTDKPLGPCR